MLSWEKTVHGDLNTVLTVKIDEVWCVKGFIIVSSSTIQD